MILGAMQLQRLGCGGAWREGSNGRVLAGGGGVLGAPSDVAAASSKKPLPLRGLPHRGGNNFGLPLDNLVFRKRSSGLPWSSRSSWVF